MKSKIILTVPTRNASGLSKVYTHPPDEFESKEQVWSVILAVLNSARFIARIDSSGEVVGVIPIENIVDVDVEILPSEEEE